MTAQPWLHPNPWTGAVILKLTLIRTGSPIAFFTLRFSSACLEAIAAHSPELLTPLVEGRSAPALLALPRQQRDTTEPATVPDWWDR